MHVVSLEETAARIPEQRYSFWLLDQIEIDIWRPKVILAATQIPFGISLEIYFYLFKYSFNIFGVQILSVYKSLYRDESKVRLVSRRFFDNYTCYVFVFR